jgi:transcriptional regulator with XRE-family HTH domain
MQHQNRPASKENMKKTKETIVDQLRDAIVNSGLTVSEIANRTGINQSNLSRFVAGHSILKLEKAARVTSLFGMRLTRPKKI